MADYQQNSLPHHGANAGTLDEAEEFYKRRSPDSTIPQSDSRRSSIRLSQVGNNLASRINTTAVSSTHPQPSQPLNDAVATAVHTADSTMSPEIIQLITQKVYQDVLQQLQHNQPTPTSAPPVQPPLNIAVDQPEAISISSNSPNIERAQLHMSETLKNESKYSLNGGGDSTMPPVWRDSTSRYDRDTSPFSRRIPENTPVSDAQLRVPKPDPIRRLSSDADATVLEKIWGKLFDDQGEGTERLSQFLRGIAMHLIHEYEPQHSLVVTPDKMQKFYHQTQLTENTEIYPWQHVFDDNTSSLSRLFRESEIRAEHHLVQSTLETRPDIPGLTPNGFAAWMTFLLKAHPDHEFERLAKTLKEMAIDNPDHKQERFPKELSRRQFPTAGDDKMYAKFVDYLKEHCKIPINSRANSVVEPEYNEVTSSPRKAPPRPTVEDVMDENDHRGQRTVQAFSSQCSPTSKSARQRRERGTLTDSETSIDEDSSDVPTPQPRPIERERKPYTAQPGQGKSHELTTSGDEKADPSTFTDGGDLRRTKSVSNQARPRMSAPIAIHQRGDLGNPPQADGGDLSRIQTTTGAPDSGARQRHRGNSNIEVETQPHRRPRSNSTYANENGQRYHPSRTTSFSKVADYVRPTVPEPNYSTQAPNNTYSQGQYAHTGRQEYKPYANYGSREPRYREGSRDRDRDRDRERETRNSRVWNQNTTNTDPYVFNSPDEYFRKQGSQPVNVAGYQQYPPNAYRDRDRDVR